MHVQRWWNRSVDLTFLVVEDRSSNKRIFDMAQARGFFRNALNALVEARMRQASQYVNGALLMLDDETLKANGHSRAELKKRGGGYYPL